MTRAATAAALALAALALAPCHAPRSAARAPQSDEAPEQSRGFGSARRVRAEGPPEAAAFEFEAGGYAYHVAANGNGRRTKGDKTRRFNLRLDGRDFIEGVYFAAYDGDLLLACGVNDGEEAGGLVLRVEQPSMRVLWRQGVPALNPGRPLRDGRHLYLTGAGFVGKLDLRTGEYVWQHEDLSGAAGASPGDFDSFETPELAGGTVLFRARPVYNRRRTLVADRKTGKIIRIE